MKVEAENEVGSEKHKCNKERVAYFSGYRVRRLNSRVETMNLLVSEVREKDYITVFLIERMTGRVIMPQKYGEIHSGAEIYSGLWFRQRLKWESLKWMNRLKKLTGQK